MAKERYEELIIKRIETTIKGIEKGIKSPLLDEDETYRRFKRLKPLNAGMHEDLLTKYNRAVLLYTPADIPASKRLNY